MMRMDHSCESFFMGTSHISLISVSFANWYGRRQVVKLSCGVRMSKLNRMRVGAVALMCASLVSTAVSAATLDTIVGKVLVNKGKGFRTVTSPTEISPGDSIMVKENSGADIVYENGTRVHVNPGAIATVSASPPPLDLGLAGTGGIDTATLIIGGAVIGGGIAAVIALTDNGASP